MRLLVTGSSGLIGAQVCEHFHAGGWQVHGLDSHLRGRFFGAEGETCGNRRRLEASLPGFVHHELDVRDRGPLAELIDTLRPDAIVHAAAQPSHELSARMPLEDFDINAVGTLNLLEAARRHVPGTVFVHLSTNKVYGDAVNRIPLRELESRWEFEPPEYADGIAEEFPIDRSTHSPFGAGKAAADLLTQEYGRYYGLKSCSLRGGCFAGPRQAGVEAHGFLSYLARCNLEGRTYTVYGHSGKQVRDNLHSLDVARFIGAFIEAPRVGEVYNLGGGKPNSCSILEAFRAVEMLTGREMQWRYSGTARRGDHICYYSNLAKLRSHYPGWEPSIGLDQIFEELVEGWRSRLAHG